MIDITEILAHWYAGRSQHDVAGSLGVARGTIRRYVEPAIAAGFVPGGPPMSQADWAPLVKEWFPHLTDTRLRQVTWPDFDKHREYIVEMLRSGVTKATIHQRLRDEHGVSASVASFKRYVAANLAEDAVREKVTVLRADPEPGLEAQIDYGLLGSWTDPRTGRSQRIWAFVMVLSHSRHMFVRPVVSMDQASWTASHVEAFAFFGGCPARLVPDNLKTGVDKPDLYDPKLNRAYAELAAHYGVLIDPARARKPKDKPRVEKCVQYVRSSFFAGEQFLDLADCRARAATWCAEVAGQRIHGTTRARPVEVFTEHEAALLLAAPDGPFEIPAYTRPKVARDRHAQVDHALYSVPGELIGQRLVARADARTVKLYHRGQLIKVHPWQAPGRRHTDPADLPSEVSIYAMRDLDALARRAAAHGEHVGAYAVALLDHPLPWTRMRQVYRLLGLARRHGAQQVDHACARALEVEAVNVGLIDRMLTRGLAAPAGNSRVGEQLCLPTTPDPGPGAAGSGARVVPAAARFVRDPDEFATTSRTGGQTSSRRRPS